MDHGPRNRPGRDYIRIYQAKTFGTSSHQNQWLLSNYSFNAKNNVYIVQYDFRRVVEARTYLELSKIIYFFLALTTRRIKEKFEFLRLSNAIWAMAKCRARCIIEIVSPMSSTAIWEHFLLEKCPKVDPKMR